MTARPQILIAQMMPRSVLDAALDTDIEVVGGMNREPLSHDDLLKQVPGMSGLIVTVNDKVGADVFDAAGDRLCVVATDSVGTDHVAVEEATKRGIVVCNTPDILTAATAQHALSLIMTCANNLISENAKVENGDWPYWDPYGYARELGHSTLGVVGCGRIGGQLVNYTRQLFERIVVFDPYIERPPQGCVRMNTLEELLEEADVTSLHFPLTPETYHLLSDPQFEIMGNRKGGAPDLINAARGAQVDTDALVRALEQGWLRAAGLDVFEEEPLPVNHPINKFPNVVKSRHVASGGVFTRIQMPLRAGRCAVAVILGNEPASSVNYAEAMKHPRWAA